MVVEGVGDHGCEYMTGGRVVIIGQTGRNFAAGMSGGIAYIYDPLNQFEINCNKELVGLENNLNAEDDNTVRQMLESHLHYTNSSVAHKILSNWAHAQSCFVKVIPHDYKRVLEHKAEIEAKAQELSRLQAGA